MTVYCALVATLRIVIVVYFLQNPYLFLCNVQQLNLLRITNRNMLFLIHWKPYIEYIAKRKFSFASPFVHWQTWTLPIIISSKKVSHWVSKQISALEWKISHTVDIGSTKWVSMCFIVIPCSSFYFTAPYLRI